MNVLTLLRFKHAILGRLAPKRLAANMAHLFLTPRRLPKKKWEVDTLAGAEKVQLENGLQGLRWGTQGKTVLLMHGWESRSTHMITLVAPLIQQGFQVLAIDAPMHGESQGQKSNPVEFANSILVSEKEYGPFAAVVGHSMGAAALAIALEDGLQCQCCVLVSSPACILDGLNGFAQFMNLPNTCHKYFIEAVEAQVGRKAQTLDVAKTLKQHQPNSLLIHCQDDKEIPFRAFQALHLAHPNSQIFTPEGLGHRRIIRDANVAQRIGQFISMQLTV